jgi:hypothetical protein
MPFGRAEHESAGEIGSIEPPPENIYAPVTGILGMPRCKT